MQICWSRLPTLYNLAAETLVEWKNFDASELHGLPGNVKEDCLRLALLRGKAQNRVSCFLHPRIRELRINESRLSSKDLENISQCLQTRILEMNPPITQRFNHSSLALSQMFCNLKRLVKLHMRRNDGVTDNVIETLTTACPLLQELDVCGCTKLTDRAAASLSTLRYLRAINLSQSKVSDEGLLAMGKGVCAQSLNELTLNSCDVSNNGLKTLLNSCHNLTILICSGCPNITGDFQLELETTLKNNTMKQVSWTIYF